MTYRADEWHTTRAACTRCTRDARLDDDGQICDTCGVALCGDCTCPDHESEVAA